MVSQAEDFEPTSPHFVPAVATRGVRSVRESSQSGARFMYDYPQIFPLSSNAVRGLVVAVVVAALLAAISARVLRLRRRGTLWLFAFTAIATLAALLAALDVPPLLEAWDSVNHMSGAIVFAAIFWLVIIAGGRSERSQMTLIELLVVIGITCGMIWSLTPQVFTPVEISRTNQCSNNLKTIAIGIHSHAEYTEGELVGPFVREGEGPARSWRVELLPFMDQERLRKRYNDRETWDAPANRSVARWSQHPFVCPNNLTPGDERERSFTAYLACTGPTAFFPSPMTANGRGRRFADIRDGISNTVMVVEACGQNVVWTEPRDVDVEKVSFGVNLPGFRRGESAGLLSSHDPGSVGMVMGDGSVRRLSVDVDPSILKGMLTIDGREPASFD